MQPTDRSLVIGSKKKVADYSKPSGPVKSFFEEKMPGFPLILAATALNICSYRLRLSASYLRKERSAASGPPLCSHWSCDFSRELPESRPAFYR